MLGRELWAAYLQRHFVPPSFPPEIMNADADTVARLIWPLLSKFRAKMEVLTSTRFDRGYDPEANAALWRMVEAGNLDPIDDCSAGAGRVLYERASWSIVALTMEARRVPAS
ncbi:hypothetical protein [Polymorphum gilvum]|uniref:hypothetical protein n=1 Tax=Polymorphum gilvum TaxID=991904 RepID=UPI0011D2128E|nr:hypothetical protein [Polymorphum gilvum]